MEKNPKNVRKLITVFLTIFILGSSISVMANGKGSFIPDFAFPEKVEITSDSILNESLERKDDRNAFRAMMDLVIARNLKDEDSFRKNILLIDSVEGKLSPVYKSLSSLLKAKMYSEYYDNGRINFDNRLLPMEDLPENIDDWSGEMFKTRILCLIDSATMKNDEAENMSLSAISSIVTTDDFIRACNYRVEDFILLNSIRILGQYSDTGSSSTIPFFSSKEDITETLTDKIYNKQKALAERLISESKEKGNDLAIAVGICEASGLLPYEKRGTYLWETAEKMNLKEGKAIIIDELWRVSGFNSPEDQRKLYLAIRDWLDDYPSSLFSKRIRNIEEEITQERMETELPRMALPAERIKGKVTLSNIDKGYLLLYKISDNQVNAYENLIEKRFPGNSKPLAVIPISTDKEVPFTEIKEVELPELQPGLYVAIPSKNSVLPKGWNPRKWKGNYSTFRVSDINILTLSDNREKNSGRIFVVYARNQKPIKGATVSFFTGDRKKPSGSLVTDSNGMVKIPEGYYRVEASYGKSKAVLESGYNYYPEHRSLIRQAGILTDLSIYHPGDSVKFVVVGWKAENYNKSLLRNFPIDITLRDANYSSIGSVTLTLDSLGRAEGAFLIPKGRLLGNYRLVAEYAEKPGFTAGTAEFEVSDYKLPGFYVRLEKDSAVNSKPVERVIIRGKAATYSGMPVTEANVTAIVEYLPVWGRFFNNVNADFTCMTMTDENGDFLIELPTEGLKGTVFENGNFRLTGSVTSPSGETVISSPLYFSLGEDLRISPNLKSKIKISEDSLSLYVPVYDFMNLPVKRELDYKIKTFKDGQTVMEGRFLSPNLKISAKDIRSGKYIFEFSLPGSEKTETAESVVYRADDVNVPLQTPLWIPENEYTYGSGDKEITVEFGSGYDHSMLLYTVSTESGILKTEWVESDSLILKIPVETCNNGDTYFINVSGMHNLERETGTIKIVPEKLLEKLDVKVNTFRENIMAGNKEKWRFTFETDGNKVPDIAAMAVMSDKALNSLRDFNWNLNVPFFNPYSTTRLSGFNLWNAFSYSVFTNVDYSGKALAFIPEWETYGRPLAGGMQFFGPIMYKMAKFENSTRDYAEDGAVVTDASARLYAATGSNDIVMEAEETQAESPVAVQEGDFVKSEPELRPVEMPVAFFMPNLKGNQVGEVALEFVVPDFNTTWQFQILGYTDELLSANLTLDAVAAKPVMVKCNLPQYLMTGDKAHISGIIYNNTSSDVSLGGKIVLENALTGEIISEKDFDAETVAPSGNRVIMTDIDIPYDLEMIKVKTIGFGDGNSDGEAGYVMILPSSRPVVEASTFYASSDKEIISLKLPKFEKNSQVILKYCDNPVWECLLSLPELLRPETNSALTLASALYANLTGSNLLDRNPSLREGLQTILSSADSTLTLSNLMKDSGLKTVGLEMTPWVNNASAETDRMRSLSSLTDRELVAEITWKQTEGLLRLQKPDGGWSWLEGMNSSLFVTTEVLRVLGYLEQEGILSPELKEASEKGVARCDKEFISLKEKNGKISPLRFMDYLLVRSCFTYPEKEPFKKIEKECLEEIVKDWKNWDISQKAKAAILFRRTCGYEAQAEEILNSIREYAIKDESKGWSFKNNGLRGNINMRMEEAALALSAFMEISPESEAVEGLRRWLFLQKETLEWDGSVTYVSIINTLLNGSKDQVEDRRLPVVSLNGTPIALLESESLIGSYTVNLNSSEASGGALTIDRESGVPAWGGVVACYIMPVSKVKSEKTAELSIEKKIYLEEGSGRRELKKTDRLKKGDKVSVTLFIECRKDMEYVAISDIRAACLQPGDWKNGMTAIDGVPLYKEVRKDRTSFFIEQLPAGNYVISYDCNIDRDGEYSLGMATVQSLYSPIQTAHSAGKMIKIGK